MPHPLADLKLGESREVTWDVTVAHIKNGERESCWHCPQALALQELFPEYEPEVDNTLRLMEEVGGELQPVFVAERTTAIEEFIDAFDTDEPVLPGTFKATFTRLR